MAGHPRDDRNKKIGPRQGGNEPPCWGRMYITLVIAGEYMAKKGDPFFIRGQVIVTADQTRRENTIDLGTYVNLGINKGTALRVHSVQQQICDSTGLVPIIDGAAAAAVQRGAFANTAITTAPVPSSFAATEMPQLSEDYVMYSSGVSATNGNTDADNGLMTHDYDVAPQDLRQGYLLAVDTLYMYGVADDAWNEDLYVNFLLECTLEGCL